MKRRPSKGTLLGLSVLLLLIITALSAPHLAPHDPYHQQLDEGLRGPSSEHPLGQDELGRDILSRILYGSRISLTVGFITVILSLLIGITAGAVAGYKGGISDEIMMRVVDVLLAFPGILLAIALTAVLGPRLKNVILSLSLMGWVGYARLTRAQVLQAREQEYVWAAVATGASPLRVLVRHILPNIAAPLLVEASFGMGGAILAEASLSFLGLGVPPPSPSWGTMLNGGREFLLIAPHLITFPGLTLMITILATHLLGDGLRDALDVRR